MATVSLLFAAAACSVPKHMQVTEGLRPENIDRDVRFRTTYYFRAFDYCAGQVRGQPSIDSVYRFRLTGKAHSLTTAMHFESGILDAQQIDPFGATVAFDETNRQMYFKSRDEVKQEAGRERHLAEAQRLIAIYHDTEANLLERAGKKEVSELSQVDRDLLDELKRAAKFQLQQLSPGQPPPAGGDVPPGDRGVENVAGVIPAAGPASTNGGGGSGADLRCLDQRRGFQILGPQGWVTFDQDKRLIFAMSSSGRPLISTFEELSGRVLESRAPSTAELVLPLVREEIEVGEAEHQLDRFDETAPAQGPALIEAALAVLVEAPGQPASTPAVPGVVGSDGQAIAGAAGSQVVAAAGQAREVLP